MTEREDSGVRDALAKRLLDFDREVGLRFDGFHFELLLVGGGALALLGVLTRPTDDLDALAFPRELVELMEKYDIRGHAVTYEDHFPYNRDDRRQRLEIPTQHIDCYAASLEDIVASKLCSSRDQDALDIREPAVVATLDWEILDAAALEMPLNCMSERVLNDFKYNYDCYVREYRPCDS